MCRFEVLLYRSRNVIVKRCLKDNFVESYKICECDNIKECYKIIDAMEYIHKTSILRKIDYNIIHFIKQSYEKYNIKRFLNGNKISYFIHTDPIINNETIKKIFKLLNKMKIDNVVEIIFTEVNQNEDKTIYR